jgi:hypothetical protein
VISGKLLKCGGSFLLYKLQERVRGKRDDMPSLSCGRGLGFNFHLANDDGSDSDLH